MADHVSDAGLLERFVNGREEAAFATLMQRHASTVRSACRRILQSEHDTDDVMQATFLVLALKAGEIPWRDSVGGWLCAVARRLSLDARAGASRRLRRERPSAALSGEGLPDDLHPQADPSTEIDRRELRRVIDVELNRLPEKYRETVVLCDLEGLTHAQAARRLGLPSGSMSRRLGRARALLRQRLAGRGLPAAVVLICGALAGLWAASREPNGRRDVVSIVGRSIGPARLPGGRSLNLDPLLSRLGRGTHEPGLQEAALSVAAHADELAAGREDDATAREPSDWRMSVEELRRSARRMVGASRDGDPTAFLAAARRANATCVRCHLASRQGDVPRSGSGRFLDRGPIAD